MANDIPMSESDASPGETPTPEDFRICTAKNAEGAWFEFERREGNRVRCYAADASGRHYVYVVKGQEWDLLFDAIAEKVGLPPLEHSHD